MKNIQNSVIAAAALALIACGISVLSLYTSYTNQKTLKILSSNQAYIGDTQDEGTRTPEKPQYEVKDGKLLKTENNQTVILVDDFEKVGFSPVECGLANGIAFEIAERRIIVVEGCGEMGGTVWEYDVQSQTIQKHNVRLQFGAGGISPDQRYQIVLANIAGTRLLVKDFLEDKEFETDALPKNYTYTKLYAAIDGSPNAEIEWTSNEIPIASIFDANAPISNSFDEREAVSRVQVSLSAK